MKGMLVITPFSPLVLFTWCAVICISWAYLSFNPV